MECDDKRGEVAWRVTQAATAVSIVSWLAVLVMALLDVAGLASLTFGWVLPFVVVEAFAAVTMLVVLAVNR